jgi:hypothetical protein
MRWEAFYRLPPYAHAAASGPFTGVVSGKSWPTHMGGLEVPPTSRFSAQVAVGRTSGEDWPLGPMPHNPPPSHLDVFTLPVWSERAALDLQAIGRTSTVYLDPTLQHRVARGGELVALQGLLETGKTVGNQAASAVSAERVGMSNDGYER